jgi:L-amino acid N-acyltransferase YncA
MAGIRVFRREDAPQVAGLYERIFRSGDNVAPAGLVDYFERIFLDNPFVKDDIPSFVYEDKEGMITGFIGVQHRPFVLDGQPIRVLVSGPLFIDEEAGAKGVGLLLLRALLQLPHDMIVTDGATREMQKIWGRLVGVSNDLGSIQWEVVFRHSEHGLRNLKDHPRLEKFYFLFSAVRPVCRLFDSLFHSIFTRRTRRNSSSLSAEELTVENAREFSSAVSDHLRLHPEYDDKSMQWLFDELSKVKSFGTLERILLRDDKGSPVGMVIYYLAPFGVSRVVHFASRPEWAYRVLEFLLLSADQGRSLSIKGRLEPMATPYIDDFGCRYKYGELFSLVKGRPDVYALLFSGDGILSRMDGEWWLGFYGEDFRNE